MKIGSKGTAFFSTNHENMETDEDQSGYPPWSDLPAPAVENIYSFLNRRDQMSMSLVCRNWHEEFSSPNLWRKVRFRIPDLEADSEMSSNVLFARRYGAMFHHVEIFFVSVPLRLSSTFQTYDRHLKCFLQAVTLHSQLLSISFNGIIHHWANVSVAAYAELYEAILSLLQSQKRLRFVEITGCQYEAAEAAKIVKVLFLNNSKTLRYLHLTNFVFQQPRSEFADVTVDDDLNFRVFMSLEKLSIDFSPMFENMMVSFYEYRNRVDMKDRRGRLKEIKLQCDGRNTLDYLGIHEDVWKYFVKIFPCLSVDLCIYCWKCDTKVLSTFIVPHMPLTALYFYWEFNNDDDEAFGTLLRHITSCRINECLEVLKISMQSSSNISQTLISCTNVCSELKTLELKIAHPVVWLDSVFNSWLESRPDSLDSVKITIRLAYLSEGEKVMYTYLYDFYAPLLQSFGINLSLRIKSLTYPFIYR